MKIKISNQESDVIHMNDSNHSNRRWAIGAIYCAIFFISLWIRSGFPVFAIADSIFDDLLFQKIARSLLHNDWLGPYDKLTLAKGMFYPFFISTSSFLGLPLKIAEHILYLGCSFFLAKYVSRVSRNTILGIVIYAFLAFNPVFWTESLARVIREGIYVSLSMILIVLIVATLFPATEKSSNKLTIFKPLLIGIIGGCYWLTREEGIWLAPAILLIYILALIPKWKNAGFSKAISGNILKTFIFSALAFCIVVGGVRFENWRHYGIFETTEFHASSFLNAYGAIARIKHDSDQRYVVFPEDARKRAYSVSEAARELEPYLEGEPGTSWKRTGRAQIPDASEIAAGWFMWAFRDAVSLSGHYTSGEEAMKFYDRLADEINTACDDKKIECLSHRATQAPIFQTHYILDTLTASKTLLPLFITLNESPSYIDLGIQPSPGTDPQLNEINDLVGGVSLKQGYNSHISGWAAAKNHAPELLFVGEPLGENVNVDYKDAQDVENVYPGLSAVRFEASVKCEKPCEIQTRLKQNLTESLSTAKTGSILDRPDLKIFIDYAHSSVQNPITSARSALQHHLADNIASLYKKIMPFLFFLAALGFLVSLFRFIKDWHVTPLFVLCFASLAAVSTRLVLLAYLEVTSIPSLNILYVSPASPFIVIFSITGCYQLLQTFRKKPFNIS